MEPFDLSKKRKHVTVVREAWEFYSYTYGEDQRASILFDVWAAEEPEHVGYGACRRMIVYVPDQSVEEDGLPDPEAFAQAKQVEAQLVAALESARVDCIKVGRMTYNGLCDVIFQVEDVEGFERCFAALQKQGVVFKVELVESEGWSFFDAKVRPRPEHWRWIKDRQTRDRLLAAGSDPKKPHTLDHTFLGEAKALEALAKALEEDGFDEPHLGDGRLSVSQEASLDVDEIHEVTEALRDLAASHHVAYDGWGAAVVR
jgi:regulator of RNase E activity RraB